MEITIENTMEKDMSDYIAMKTYLFNVERNEPMEWLKGAWKIQTIYEAGHYGLMISGNELRKLFGLEILSKQRIFEIAMNLTD